MGSISVLIEFVSFFLTITTIRGQIPETVDENGQQWVGPIRRCPIGSDEKINACTRQIILDITSKVGEGIPELGLEPIDPLKLAKFDIDEKLGSFRFQFKAKNVLVHGMTKYSYLDFKIDTKNQTMSYEYEVPSVRFEADYKLGGQIIIPLAGSGPISLAVSNVKSRGHWTMKKTVREDGVTIAQLDNAFIEHLSLGRVNMRARGLFNGNPVLSGFAHYVVNNFGSQVFEIVKPQISDTISDVLTNGILNPVLAKLPYLADYF